jgi:hypothetical protein
MDKRCSGCWAVMPATSVYWYRNRSQRDGWTRECKICTRIRQERKWRHDPEFRERSRQRAHQWYHANPERAKQYAQQWQKAHPEIVRDTKQRWKKRHPEGDMNRLLFRGRRISLDHNPRTGVCAGPGPHNGGTNIHHDVYDPTDPLAHTRELCVACHTRVTFDRIRNEK